MIEMNLKAKNLSEFLGRYNYDDKNEIKRNVIYKKVFGTEIPLRSSN